MAKVIDINTIWERNIQPQYSILNLLIKAKSKGLQAKHIRYALIIDNDKSNLSDFTIRRVERDFNDLNIDLIELEKQGRIEKGSIPPGNSISNILKRLYFRNIIRKDKRFKNTRWKISLEYLNDGVRSNNKSTLDAYDTEHVMYGVSKRIYLSLSREDQSKIDDCINEIDTQVKEARNIVVNRYFEIWQMKIMGLLDANDHQELKDLLLKDNNLIRFLVAINGIINDLDYTSVFPHKDILDKHPEFIKRAIQIYKSHSIDRITNNLTYVCSAKKENPLEHLTTK